MKSALAIALLAAAPAGPLPFAPPIDQPLLYRQTERSIDAKGAALSFTLTEEVRYARDGPGYVMTTQALTADAQAPAGPAAMFRAAMRPFLGIPVRLHLSPSGDPGELIDPDAVWARILAAERGSIDAVPGSENAARLATLQATANSFASMPADQRETMMKVPAIALLGLDVPELAVGASAPVDETTRTPLGKTLHSIGTIRREPDGDGTRRYVREVVTTGEDKSRLHETDTTTLSASSGLLLDSVQRTTAIDPSASNGERLLSEQELALTS